jgi:hypothetical protein
VDEAVFDDGEAELLVELVQRLHLVLRDCSIARQFQVSCRGKARQNCIASQNRSVRWGMRGDW